MRIGAHFSVKPRTITSAVTAEPVFRELGYITTADSLSPSVTYQGHIVLGRKDDSDESESYQSDSHTFMYTPHNASRIRGSSPL